MKALILSLAALGVASLAGTAASDDQGYGPGGGAQVPRGHMPPPGACRVWYPGRPPGQQPAPTDCARAQYEAARHGGRVVYGGAPDGRRWDDDRRDRAQDPDRRWERDGDDGWVRVCVARDWYGRCLRTELRRR